MKQSSRLRLFLIALFFATEVTAQSSASHQIEGGTVNNGGYPPTPLVSASHQMTVGSIGDGPTGATITGPSHQIGGGFPGIYAAPGEVVNLRLPSGTALSWNPEPSVGSYSVYRGEISELPITYGIKVQTNLSSPAASDGLMPSIGACLFYLVTATNRLAEEGPKGFDSNGIPNP